MDEDRSFTGRLLTSRNLTIAIVLLLLCADSAHGQGTITRVAGNGIRSFSGDGGPALFAKLSSLYGVTVDSAGNLYIADAGNGRVRKVSYQGIITTVAGGGTSLPGNGGPATSAALSPWGVAVDSAANLYIVDGVTNCVRKVSAQGIITTIAGNRTTGYSGDGGPATSAALSFSSGPYGVAVDSASNVYIADRDNNRVRKVNAQGIISTVAGNGTQGNSGDGGLAVFASVDSSSGVAVDSVGNLYIAGLFSYVVREVLGPARTVAVISPGGIVNGASFAPAPATVAPGSIISVFGAYLCDGYWRSKLAAAADCHQRDAVDD